MRWKLITLTSFLGAFVAGGAWCLLTIVGFSQFRVLAVYPGLASLGLIIPILLGSVAGMIVYRRTAQRRKTQALLTMVLTLLLTLGIYLAVMRVFQGRLSMVALPGNSTNC